MVAPNELRSSRVARDVRGDTGGRRRSRLDFGSLRVCISVGAAMPVEVLRGSRTSSTAWSSRATGCRKRPGWRASNRPGAIRKVGSIGAPIDGVQMRVVDEHGTEVPTGTPGEIEVHSHNVMKGYWNSAEDGAEPLSTNGFRRATSAGSMRTATSSSLPARTSDHRTGPLWAPGLQVLAGDCFPRHRPGLNVVAAHIDKHPLFE